MTRQIREYFGTRPSDLDEMWIYVRRTGKQLRNVNNVEWLRRGLAIAAIEGGRRDYRDTIVSLVLLRYAAERVNISVEPLFRQIQGPEYSAPENKPLFENARTHAAQDVAYTVRAFGPKDWANEVQGRPAQ